MRPWQLTCLDSRVFALGFTIGFLVLSGVAGLNTMGDCRAAAAVCSGAALGVSYGCTLSVNVVTELCTAT